MKFPTTFLLFLSTHHALAFRNLCRGEPDDDDSAYITSVCSPATPPDQSAPAPCAAIQNIETACLPNGTSPLALDAHAQCLCGGSYFPEWIGCRKCLLVHGALSPLNFSYFTTVLSSASSQLCQGTPSAAFATLFTEVQAEIPEPTTGDTVRTDASSGNAAVSVYYTASGPQGPGVITGSATAATATPTVSGSGSTGGESLSAGAKSSTKAPSATTSSSSNVAVPTGPSSGGKGALIAAVVGGALAVAI
ncbi:uncharacterized protein F4822DRAFT_398201 [Hypoxylon trugodes]|uniref:uncharacterized protein n=1 Tax=Hypoxylon trugodes TaxID=326681 RepID=UPI00219D28A7|nr:uncharacterized protein F4822DRAFT_398201 [Hypoxylon trugodes]KAI1389415.1 hypothetical protein F4822DRAFT_398201 [Hypoxylon trugodes]